MNDERVTRALDALRNADAGACPGSDAEIRALLAFRRKRREWGFERRCRLAFVAAAVVLAALSATFSRTSSDRKPVEAREIATPFFPLTDRLPNDSNVQLVRITVPASTMRRVGLPISDDHLSDPVLADVLLGQDDLARAIRFVSYVK